PLSFSEAFEGGIEPCIGFRNCTALEAKPRNIRAKTQNTGCHYDIPYWPQHWHPLRAWSIDLKWRFKTWKCSISVRCASVVSRKCLPPSLLGSHRHLRDINHTSALNLLVSLCLRIAVRAHSKRCGNSETGHWALVRLPEGLLGGENAN